MNYYKVCDNDYIIGVGTSTNKTDNAISEAEYQNIIQIIQTKPTAPDGYDYRLKTDFTWELVEVPAVEDEQKRGYTEGELLAMTNAELEQILYGYGRTANMNKENMVDLILRLQEEN